jgi:Zn-dependent M28 family amino/carboxypeptidase
LSAVLPKRLLTIAFIASACAPASRPQASWPCSESRAPLIRRAIAEADGKSGEEHFIQDIRALEGVRDGRSGEGLAKATDYVEAAFRQNEFAVTRQKVKGRRGQIQENLIAEIHGDKGPIIIATAHLDTVPGSPGADDNASGLATLMAIARSIHRARTEDCNILHADVRLAAFAHEETGLRGSHHYVASLTPEERLRIRAVYNFDMVAYARSHEGSQAWPAEAQILVDIDPSGKRRPLRRRGDFIGVIGLANEDGERVLHPLNEARAYVPNLPIEGGALPPILLQFAPDFERGDHLPFWRANIPAVTIGDTAELRNPNYHAPSDTLDTLDTALGAKVARWGAAAILIAATSDLFIHPDKHAVTCSSHALDPK